MKMLDLGIVCRFCLGKNGLEVIYKHRTIDIPKKIQSLTHLEIDDEDNITKLICADCTLFLEKIEEFKEKCVESFKILQNESQLLAESEERRALLEDHPKLCFRNDYNLEFIECLPQKGSVRVEDDVVSFDPDSPETLDNSESCAQSLAQNVPEKSDEELDSQMQESKLEPELENTVACPLCGEQFAGGKVMVTHHIKSDHADDDNAKPKIRQCFFCPKAYSSYQLLKYHLNFHPQKVWHCPQCDKGFKKKGVFIDHLRMHANERHYECKVCGKRFTMLKYLSSHRQLHKGKKEREKDVDCPDDGGEEATKNCDSQQNRSKDDLQSKFQCSICLEGFQIQAQLDIHQQSDHVPTDDSMALHYACTVCSKVYNSLQQLDIHRQIHDLGESWSCADCTIKFCTNQELEEHRKTHDRQTSSHNFLCVYCGREFITSRYLNRHLLSHAKEHSPEKQAELYECEICGKQMKLKSNYTNHRKSHKTSHTQSAPQASVESTTADGAAKKVYLCNICGHNCGSSSNLAVHLRRHNGQSICECSVCGKGFPRRSDLVMHMRKHTGEKPFGCSHCGKRFSRRDKLRIHIRTHTGEKPYECPCGRAYSQRNDLKTHQKRNTCGQNFDMSKLLAPHTTSICIKSPERRQSPSPIPIEESLDKRIHDSGRTGYGLSKLQANQEELQLSETVCGSNGTVLAIAETSPWGSFMVEKLPQPDSVAADRLHYDCVFASGGAVREQHS